MSKPLSELKDKYIGKDVWIVLAGSSMDYVSKEFFENKIVLVKKKIYLLFMQNTF